MGAGRFEIYGHDGRRWLIDSVHGTRTKALLRCDQLAEDAACAYTTLQVTDAEALEGRGMVVHEQTVPRGGRTTARMHPVTEASYCARLVDYYALHARLVVGRLLRRFLDDERLTALELMHDYTRLRRLMRDDRLYPLALNHVAALQAKAAEVPTAQRRQEIDKAVHQVIDRARGTHAYAALAEALERGGIAAALAALPADRAPEHRRLDLAAGLARYLRSREQWRDKLAALLDLAEPDPGPEACAVLDETVAEVLQSPEAVEELLGHGDALVDRLIARVQLAGGRVPADRGAEPDGAATAARLARGIAEGRCQQAAATLLGQVAAVLHGTRPLAGQVQQERAAFESLVGSLSSLGGLAGGPEMADAVTRRARLVYGDAYENLEPRPAVECVSELLSPRSARIGYLLALAASPFGRKYQAVMVQVLTQTLKGLRDRKALLQDGGSPSETATMVQELQQRLALLDSQTE